MDKLITALDNNYINKKLRNLNKYEIKYEDISYQEGIFEILENEKIDIILLSEILKGPYNIKELINKIKEKNNKIEIIIILEKKSEDLEKFLLEKNINNYFYNNQLSIKDFNNLDFISQKLNNNIEEIKNIILKNKSNKNILNNKNNLLKNKKLKYNLINYNKCKKINYNLNNNYQNNKILNYKKNTHLIKENDSLTKYEKNNELINVKNNTKLLNIKNKIINKKEKIKKYFNLKKNKKYIYSFFRKR